ncbi:rubredoxin [Cytophagaceae bacterium DM2B3-1]|uniref:Rubredoxin n=1 Tax=Xanthocytophaga flava TaxID=3048013 RepID=A0ABT7CFK8_9BACT|nr:rubredoxin [Xanthocytophaga flavus]MDJ1492524.1 rubredoxin [Xanthocytophaga flavus]
MRHSYIVKINFTGGIVPAGQLQQILGILEHARVRHVRFGLRQQLLIEVVAEEYETLDTLLKQHNIVYEFDTGQYPNIVSSYPAEEIFSADNWLGEGIYKDIFDLFDYRPQLKINISDNNQSFSPFFTGNINWIASSHAHFWYLYVRFPKTNSIFAWKELIYSNDIPQVSKTIEKIIWEDKVAFYANDQAEGDKLAILVKQQCEYIAKPAKEPLELSPFRLPYYEGFNRYGDKTWLGIYRRDESFPVNFLMDICKACSQTKIGQLCVTSWKSLIIKGIEAKDRLVWDKVLTRHQINVRHAANELNWQIEDESIEGLELKQQLIKHLDANDLRTFGLSFAIQTRPKSELFGCVIIRKKQVLRFGDYTILSLYDILYTDDFNPNSRKLYVFEKNLLKSYLGEQVRRLCKTYLRTRIGQQKEDLFAQPVEEAILSGETSIPDFVYQCKHCYSVYDPFVGEPESNILALTSFDTLPESYCCPLCEAGKTEFIRKERSMVFV